VRALEARIGARELRKHLRHACVPPVGQCVGSDRIAIPGAAQRRVDRSHHRQLITEGHHRPQRLAAYNLTVASNVGGHHRQATGHRFEENVGPSLVAGRQYEDIGSTERPPELIGRNWTEKMHPVGNAARLRQRFQSIADVTLGAQPLVTLVLASRESLGTAQVDEIKAHIVEKLGQPIQLEVQSNIRR